MVQTISPSLLKFNSLYRKLLEFKIDMPMTPSNLNWYGYDFLYSHLLGLQTAFNEKFLEISEASKAGREETPPPPVAGKIKDL